MEEHCAQFAGDEGDEHKLEWTQLHHDFCDIVDNARAVHEEDERASEEELMAQLTSEGDEHKDLVEALAAKADAIKQRVVARRRRARSFDFDGAVVGAGAS